MTAGNVTMAATEAWIKTPRGRLFLREWAGDDRAPVILMHDSLGSVDLWSDFPQMLATATGRPVIAYDRLGFGRSDRHPGLLAVPGFIAAEASGDFRIVIQSLGLDRFALLGHSVGGGMALDIAARWPEQCEALVTIAAQTFAEPRTLDGIRLAQKDFDDPGQMQRLARYHGDKADWVMQAWTGSWLSPDFADWSLDDTIVRVRSPVLAIHGTDDPYGSPAHPERIGALSGGPVHLRLLPGEGHFPHRSNPKAVLAELAAFLSAIPSQIEGAKAEC